MGLRATASSAATVDGGDASGIGASVAEAVMPAGAESTAARPDGDGVPRGGTDDGIMLEQVSSARECIFCCCLFVSWPLMYGVRWW